LGFVGEILREHIKRLIRPRRTRLRGKGY